MWPSERPHLAIEDIRDWFASYVYLPRLRDDAALDGALQNLVEDLAHPYAFAASFDEETGAYSDAVDGKALLPGTLGERAPGAPRGHSDAVRRPRETQGKRGTGRGRTHTPGLGGPRPRRTTAETVLRLAPGRSRNGPGWTLHASWTACWSSSPASPAAASR